jgi:hypothetical protein
MLYTLCIPGFVSFPLEGSSNPKFAQVSWYVQNWISVTPQVPEIITPDPWVVWWCVYTFWKGLKIIYNFYVDCFPWICASFSQLGFLKSSSVPNRICPKTVKWNWKTCHFEIHLNQKGSWPIHHFWPNCSRSSVPELILTLAPKLNFSFQSSAEICAFTLFSGRHSFGSAWLSRSCKDALESGTCYLQCRYWSFPQVSLWIIVKWSSYSACSIMSGTEFQQSGRLQKS